MSIKTEFQSNNTDIQAILDIVNSLEEAGGGADIETCSVNIYDLDGIIEYVCATVYQDGNITYWQVEELTNDVTIENVIKGSCVCVITGNDMVKVITGATTIYQHSYGLFAFQINDASARIGLDCAD